MARPSPSRTDATQHQHAQQHRDHRELATAGAIGSDERAAGLLAWAAVTVAVVGAVTLLI